jgi:hypothetical protein
VRVEIITYAPTAFYHCQHCELTLQQIGVGDRFHRRELSEALPADLLEEFHEVADWIGDLVDTFGNRVSVKIVDAASIEGFWKSLRYGVRMYPAVIVDGRVARAGADWASIGSQMEELLAAEDKTETQGSKGR